MAWRRSCTGGLGCGHRVAVLDTSAHQISLGFLQVHAHVSRNRRRRVDPVVEFVLRPLLLHA